MGYNIGCPTIKLTRANSFGKGKDKHHGNYKAIPLECLSERYCSDPDCDKNKTADNLYFSDFYPNGIHFKDGRFVNANFTSGEDVAEYWNDLADNYTYKTKDGKTKTLRSDAVIAYGGIFKPEKAMLDNMTDAEKMEFFKTSIGIICDLYSQRGMTMDYIVLHKDEQQWHLHYGGHDDSYQLSDKIGLKLWKNLNRNVPKALRKRGYDVNDLVQYDPDKDLTEEELIEYKAKHKERKTRNGRNSRKYKADKTIEVLETQEQSQLAVLRLLQAQIDDKQQELADLPSQDDIDAKRSELEGLERDITKGKAIKSALVKDVQGLVDEKQSVDSDIRKAMDERDYYEAEAKKAKQSYSDSLKNRVSLKNIDNLQNRGNDKGRSYGD